MLRKTPKTFNTVNVILSFVGKCFAMIQPVVLSEAVERIVASEGVEILTFARTFFQSRNDWSSHALERVAVPNLIVRAERVPTPTLHASHAPCGRVYKTKNFLYLSFSAVREECAADFNREKYYAR